MAPRPHPLLPIRCAVLRILVIRAIRQVVTDNRLLRAAIDRLECRHIVHKDAMRTFHIGVARSRRLVNLESTVGIHTVPWPR